MLKTRAIMLFAALFLCLSCAVGASLAEEVTPVASASISTDFGEIAISSATIEGAQYLFLPSCGDLSRLKLTVSGLDGTPAYWRSESDAGRAAPFTQSGTVDWTQVADETEAGVFGALLVREADGQQLLRLNVMRSENIRSLFLTSNDPVNEGRAWLEDCARHERETSASMAIVSADGKIEHADSITKLRGRGNTTWKPSKKAYQFKLKSKADLLKTGDRSERNRTWVLLANAFDPSFLRNRIALDIGLELGLSETSRSEAVDLYYDGEYRGNYLLCEKVEVNEGRVEIADYDEIIKMRNGKTSDDLDAMEVVASVNRFGRKYTYIPKIEGGNSTNEGGYLLEVSHVLDVEDINGSGNPCWFQSSGTSRLICKSPKYANDEMMNYIMDVIEAAWQTLVNHGVNSDTGLGIESYFNVDAFARVALIHELTRNTDGFRSGSTFFVLPAGERRLEPGPIWDFDLSYVEVIPRESLIKGIQSIQHAPNKRKSRRILS